MFLKSSSSAIFLPAFAILAGLQSGKCNYMTEHHLKHSSLLFSEYQLKLFFDSLIILVI